MEFEKEQKILLNIINKFNFIKHNDSHIKMRRITIRVPIENILEVLEYIKNSLGFSYLIMITGLDCYQFFQVVYHLSNDRGIIINVKLDIKKDNPVIRTCMKIFEGALFYERELKDLLGINVEGLPEGRRYPLPDNWPSGQYPLRKDWKSLNLEGGGNQNV